MKEDKPYFLKKIEELFSKYVNAMQEGKEAEFAEMEYAFLVGGGIIKFTDTKTSINIAKQGLKRFPNSAILKIVLAKNYTELSLLDEAKALITELDVLLPNDLQVRIAKGTYLIKAGKIEEAIADFDFAISIAEEDATVRNATTKIGIIVDPLVSKEKTLSEIGDILLEAGLPEKAIPYFGQAMEMGDEKYEAAVSLAECYAKSGNNEDAIELYDAILQQEPFFTYVWIALASLYLSMKDYDNAIEACEYVLAYDKENNEALQALSKAYLEKGESEKANDGVDKSIETANRMVDKDMFYLHLFDAYVDTEDYEKMEKFGKKLIDLHPESHWGWMYMTNALINTSRWEESIPYAEKALEFDNDSEEFLFYYALACMMCNKNDKAIWALERVLEINPDYENKAYVYNNLSISYDYMGDTKKAIEFNKKAREIDPDIKLYEE